MDNHQLGHGLAVFDHSKQNDPGVGVEQHEQHHGHDNEEGAEHGPGREGAGDSQFDAVFYERYVPLIRYTYGQPASRGRDSRSRND